MIFFTTKRWGFTLIELLIVVAIIAILAAIAVPNFLEAQTRAKVSRCHTDIRTLVVGIESYVVDYNRIPINAGDPNGVGVFHAAPQWNWYGLPWVLSTPVAFVTNAFLLDPFATAGSVDAWSGTLYVLQKTYFWNQPAYDDDDGDMNTVSAAGMSSYNWRFNAFHQSGSSKSLPGKMAYSLWSQGPDKLNGFASGENNGVGSGVIYNPTNGTASVGDVGFYYVGGGRITP